MVGIFRYSLKTIKLSLTSRYSWSLTAVMNRKGFFIGDIVLGVAALFLVFIAIIIIKDVFIVYDAQVYDESSAQGQRILDDAENWFISLDFFAFFAIIAIAVGIFAMAVLIPSHPILIIPTFLLLVIGVIVAAPLSNAFVAVAESDELNSTTHEFTFIPAWGDKFPLIAFIYGILGILGLFFMYRLYNRGGGNAGVSLSK